MIELYLILVPAVFALLIFLTRRSLLIRRLLLLGALCHLGGVAFLLFRIGKTNSLFADWLAADVPGAIVIAICSLLFLASSINAYFWIPAARKFEGEHATMPEHVFCSVLCLFLATMSLVVFAANFGLLWVAVEATTLASAPLIAYHRSRGAIEAMWKYLIICSVGIGLALFGTFMLGAALRFSGSHVTDLSFAAFETAGKGLNIQWFKAAFLFCLAGYGLKMGLAPFHVWLPDAHSEAPSLVSVLLSGSLLNCSFLGVTRVIKISPESLLPFCREYLIAFGLLSLLIAACFIIRQTDFKRMLAYSSVEHMGLIAVLWGLGSTEFTFMHMIGHSACKMILFLTAGNILLAYGTRKCSQVTGMFSSMPLTAFVWIAGILFICGAPPSPLFVTELFLIQKAGPVLGGIILFLLFAIFCGMTSIALKMTMGKAENPPPAEAAAAASGLTLLPALLGLLPASAGLYFIFQL